MSVRYPVVRLHEAQRYVLRRQSGELGPGTYPEVEDEGVAKGRSLLTEAGDAADRIVELYESKVKRGGGARIDKDAFEGVMAVELRDRLAGFPAFVLTDDDFWRYLAVRGMYEFVAWRDGKKDGRPALASFGAATPQVNYDCVPLRMFIRADLATLISAGTDLEPVDLAAVSGTDLWRSHILRVRASYAPLYVKELLRSQEDGELPSLVARELAKRIRRLNTNVLMETLDAGATAKAYVREHAAARMEVRGGE